MNTNNIFEKETENIFERSKSNIKEDGDYIKNGLIYCGNCNMPKQVELYCHGQFKKIRCICKCEQEKEAKEKEKMEKKDAQMRIQRLKEIGIADETYLKWTFEYDDRGNAKLSNAMKRYCDKWQEMKQENIGILFYGNVGTGKSFFAACIANELINKGVPVLITNTMMLISAMSKDFEKNKLDILNKISRIPLLILDDIGVERDTSYGYEKLQEIIDTRYRSGKPLIVTTNLLIENLKNPTDIRYKRVYDRILEICHPIKLDGKSRREIKGIKRRLKTKEFLGI